MSKSHVEIFFEFRRQQIRYPWIEKCYQVLTNLVIIIIWDIGVKSQVNVQINLALYTAPIKGVLVKVHCEYWHIYLNIFYYLVSLFFWLAFLFRAGEFPFKILRATVVYLNLHEFCFLRRVASFQCDIEIFNRTHVNIRDSNWGGRFVHIIKTALFAFF